MEAKTSLSAKRILDFAAALFLLVISLPLTSLIAIAVKGTSGGPAFFKQHRLGRNGETFSILKFRTMFEGSEHIEVSRETYSYEADRRITPLGRFLRNTSLDELPQLINVLRGDMSLVGPRPALPHQLERYILSAV